METELTRGFKPTKYLKPKGLFGIAAVLTLVVVFYIMLGYLWFSLPEEGVKLHGTVDIGVDLLGTKNDLFWFGGFGLAVFLINTGLAIAMKKKELIAAVYLVAATGVVFVLLIGTLFFLMRLNKII